MIARLVFRKLHPREADHAWHAFGKPPCFAVIPRRDSARKWLQANPILADREIGVDKTNQNIRIGDGKTRWKDLPVASPNVVYRMLIEADEHVI